MINLDSLFADFLFSTENISWSQLLDLVLVTAVYYLLLSFLRRSRARVLLRGTLFIVTLFFVVTVLLPLPTFDYLVQVILVVILIAIPIIFQPELRYLLEELGRSVGSFSLQQVKAEATLAPLVRAVQNLSEKRVGALIVLEGEDNLEDIRDTGVPLGGAVSSELLQTIFYDGTPLHDGAILIRGDRVIAAGCVLPVTNRQLYAGGRRLGTRHRAAVGLTETTDALAIVVSEETGQIATARTGELTSGLDRTALREEIHQFYSPPARERREQHSLSQLWERFHSWWRVSTEAPAGSAMSNVGLLALAVLMALATWMFVIQQTNPITDRRIDNVPLLVEGPADGIRLMNELPETVTIVAKTSDRLLSSLTPDSFQATLDMRSLAPGLHRLDVNVDTEVRPAQIVSIDPSPVDVQLAAIVSRTVPVQAIVLGEESMSPAVELAGPPRVDPAEVVVTGAESDVSRVARVQADILLSSASAPLQRVRAVMPVDDSGDPVGGLTVQPQQVQINVEIERRADARDVGVQVLTEGQMPSGYRLSGIMVSPAEVTLLGNEEQLAQLEGAVNTFPVDISGAIDDLSIQAALDLPPGVEAVSSSGEAIRSVVVRVEVEARMGNRVRQRPVEIQGEAAPSFDINPAMVDIFLNGPIPVLNDIDASPRLLQVVIDAVDLEELEPGDSVEITPKIIYPDGILVQLQPDNVVVTAR
jgi:diadenylate cyclase